MALSGRDPYAGHFSLSRVKRRVDLHFGLVALVAAIGLTPSVEASTDYHEAQALLSKKKWAEAAIVLRKVMKESSDPTPAAVDLARALIYSGRREEALSILGQAANRE